MTPRRDGRHQVAGYRDQADEIALMVDGLPATSPLEWLLIVAAIVVALVALFAANAAAHDARDLPVWGVELCGPYALDPIGADRPRCRVITPRDLDLATCKPIELAVQARFKAAKSVRCVADNEKLFRIRQRLQAAGR